MILSSMGVWLGMHSLQGSFDRESPLSQQLFTVLNGKPKHTESIRPRCCEKGRVSILQ